MFCIQKDQGLLIKHQGLSPQREHIPVRVMISNVLLLHLCSATHAIMTDSRSGGGRHSAANSP